MTRKINTDILRIESIEKRCHDLDFKIILPLNESEIYSTQMSPIAEKILYAKKKGAAVVLFMGGHVVRSGVQKYIIDLMEHGYISGIAMNGACVIHDFELALIGATTESVAKYIKTGRFGMWYETGKINDIVNTGYADGLGYGEAVGNAILNGEQYKYKDFSLLAAGARLNIPITVHVSIGQDIIHQHPNFDGAATGGASYRDFLTLAALLQNIQDGVVMNFGSAVMAPEVFLKAMSMARNIARQNGVDLNRLTTLVCDLVDLPANWKQNLTKQTPFYYFRPYKTMLMRVVEDGGTSYYVKGLHKDTLPSLWTAIERMG